MKKSEAPDKTIYWNDYYAQQKKSKGCLAPSQFAAFCLSEMIEMDISTVVDIAAGNGRDAVFFSHHSMNVLAIENSYAAVGLLEESSKHNANLSVLFHDAIDKPVKLDRNRDDAIAFYARFFLHTLSEIELNAFFMNMAKIMEMKDRLFLEFRNDGDTTRKKVTSAHFRAFHTADKVVNLAAENNFKVVYQVSGTGFAKWKEDDASITRQIIQYRSSN